MPALGWTQQLCLSWWCLCCTGRGSGSRFPHYGKVWLGERRHHASHWHHERRGSNHDRARQHHAGVRSRHHGHQQRRWRRGGRSWVHEKWVVDIGIFWYKDVEADVFSFLTGNPTAQQVPRPSFMDYFDKQDSNKAQESYNHNQQDPYVIKTAFPDNWKVPQDGDFDFVSSLMRCHFVSFCMICFDRANHHVCVCLSYS